MTPPDGNQIAGAVLAGTYRWNYPKFDSLAARALLPVAQRPLITYAIEWLQNAGISDITVCGNRDTAGLAETLRMTDRGGQLRYCEDAIPRGAAGSLRDAAAATAASTIVVTEGTAIPAVSLPRLLDAHRESGAAVTVVVHPESQADPSIQQYVPSGVYVFDRSALSLVPDRGFYDIKENLVPVLCREQVRVAAHRASAPSARVINPATYLAVNGWMLESLSNHDLDARGYCRIGRAIVHADATVARDATLLGPIMVGPGARIDSGAVLVGPASVGAGTRIESGAVVSRSVVWNDSVVSTDASLDQTIVGNGVVVPAFRRAHHAVIGNTSAESRSPSTRVSAERHWLAGQPLWRRVTRVFGDLSLAESPARQ